jgi:hypothetical protein
MGDLVGFRAPAQQPGIHRCSKHKMCEGPRLRPDHDAMCDGGPECDFDLCWLPCQWCAPDDAKPGFWTFINSIGR